MPIIESQAADPAVHAICLRLAQRFTDIVSPLLRQAEVGDCLREAYMAAREILEKPPSRQEF